MEDIDPEEARAIVDRVGVWSDNSSAPWRAMADCIAGRGGTGKRSAPPPNAPVARQDADGATRTPGHFTKPQPPDSGSGPIMVALPASTAPAPLPPAMIVH